MYRCSIFGVANKQRGSDCGKHFYVNVRSEKPEVRSKKSEIRSQKSKIVICHRSAGPLIIRNSSFKKLSFVKF
jgi:hypothetical protein